MRSTAIRHLVIAFTVLCGVPWKMPAAELVHSKDGSGYYGYTDTPVLPWCGYHVHDPDRPAPKRVDVGPGPEKAAMAPSDAVVLFDGQDLSRWQSNQWSLADHCIIAGSGDL